MKMSLYHKSPFTIVFDRIGIAFAASVINAVILTSLLSAANSGIYTTSRMLFSLSADKQAPKFFENSMIKLNYLCVHNYNIYYYCISHCLC